MIKIFASIYEWFGIIPFYKQDLGDHLRGWNFEDETFDGTPWYLIFGIIMLITTVFAYVWQYHLLDSPRWARSKHWWLFALVTALLNFFIGFLTTMNTLNSGEYSEDLNFGIGDCFGFGLSNGLWSLLLYFLITATPLFRQFSVNCKFTTFYKP